MAEKNAITGKTEYNPKNSLCPKSYESCGRYRHKNMAEGKYSVSCVLTAYCGKTGAAAGLVFGAGRSPIAGTIECREGPKVDSKQAGLDAAAAARTAQQAKYATTNGLKLVGAGKKCKNKKQMLETS